MPDAEMDWPCNSTWKLARVLIVWFGYYTWSTAWRGVNRDGIRRALCVAMLFVSGAILDAIESIIPNGYEMLLYVYSVIMVIEIVPADTMRAQSLNVPLQLALAPDKTVRPRSFSYLNVISIIRSIA